MFRFPKTLDVITLFHKAKSPASLRVSALLKQVSAAASNTATEDQASDYQLKQRDEFELNITEDPPTEDQVRTILEYIGKDKISSIFQGASSPDAALKKFKENPDAFQRPVTVDWNNGKAVAGDNESEILKMLDALKK